MRPCWEYQPNSNGPYWVLSESWGPPEATLSLDGGEWVFSVSSGPVSRGKTPKEAVSNSPERDRFLKHFPVFLISGDVIWMKSGPQSWTATWISDPISVFDIWRSRDRSWHCRADRTSYSDTWGMTAEEAVTKIYDGKDQSLLDSLPRSLRRDHKHKVRSGSGYQVALKYPGEYLIEVDVMSFRLRTQHSDLKVARSEMSANIDTLVGILSAIEASDQLRDLFQRAQRDLEEINSPW